jgi:catechol-2,3-dioxygenase
MPGVVYLSFVSFGTHSKYFGKGRFAMIKNITIGDLTIDCTNAYRAREFYAELTGWEKTTAYDCLALKTPG